MTPAEFEDGLASVALSPVVAADANAIVLELGASARRFGTKLAALGIDELEASIARLARESNTAFAFGRYAEPRGFHLGDAFTRGSSERRTVHLGLDVYCPPGTPIAAPLPADVEVVANNAADQLRWLELSPSPARFFPERFAGRLEYAEPP